LEELTMICPSWLSFILYNPVRKAFTDRNRILDESGITPDSVVLEVGAGNGFLTEKIAERAKKVIAVELQPGMVRKLEKRIDRVHEKVEVVMADISSHPVGEEVADVCLLYYAFHEVSEKDEAAALISRAIKPGGILAIYEPVLEVSRSDMEKTVGIFKEQGFSARSSRDGTFTRFVLLRKEMAD
jgi:ubiquinone/menaquinone biosynthesis C-methylase UbiE